MVQETGSGSLATDPNGVTMQIPIDSERFNANVLGAIRYEPVVDFQTGEQKATGQADKRQKAWVIYVSYLDADDPYSNGEPETVKVKFSSNTDPQIGYGPIQLGGVRCQDGTVAVKGTMKHWISFSCESFTQEARPSSRRAAAEPVATSAA